MAAVTDELDLWGSLPGPRVVGARLRVCRLALGWRTGAFAKRLGVSTSTVNYWEAGGRQPVTHLRDLCGVLGVSPESLALDPSSEPTAGPFFRSALRAEPVRLREQTVSYTRLVADTATYFERRVGLHSARAALVPGIEDLNPSDAARAARRQLAIPRGPIDNMVRVAEAFGAIVVYGIRPSAVGIDRVRSIDAYSAHVERWPIIVMTPRGDYYRQRWDVAHELGHLILHRNCSESAEIEREANQFAAEFLLPARDVITDLPPHIGTSTELFGRLRATKEKWGVSFVALLKRARELNRISSTALERATGMLIDNGWRQREPGRMQTGEMPTVIPAALEEYLGYGPTRGTVLQEVGVPSILFDVIVSRHPVDIRPLFL